MNTNVSTYSGGAFRAAPRFLAGLAPRGLALFLAAATALLLTQGGQPARAQDRLQVESSLRPGSINFGDAAELILVIRGATSAEVDLPRVEGLGIRGYRQSVNLQIINGIAIQQLTYSYQVVPTRAGDFVIPGIEVRTGGASAKSSPLVLKVSGGTGRPSQQQQPQPAQDPGLDPMDPFSGMPALPPGMAQRFPGYRRAQRANPPPQQQQQQPAADPNDAMNSDMPDQDVHPVMVRIETPRKEIYVGEWVPARIKVMWRPDVIEVDQLISLPKLSSEAFTINKLSTDPKQSRENVNGYAYGVLQWDTAISGVKVGDYEVHGSVELGGAKPMRLGDDSFFNGGMRRRFKQSYDGTDQKFKVLPLPTAGKPAGFAGAIGQFTVTGSASPLNVKVGEPIALKMEVSGRGNFDRVSCPVFTDADGWKTYTPSTKSNVDGDTGITGSKSFEMAVVPQTNAATALPPITFSYFDPEKQKYITKTVPMPQVTIVGEVPTPVAAAPAKAAPKIDPADAPEPGPTLVPNQTDLGSLVKTLEPVTSRPVFWAANSVPLLLLGYSIATNRRRRRLANDPAYAQGLAIKQAYRDHVEGLNRAVRQNDPVLFFQSARSAVQQRLAEKWRLRPEHIGWREIARHDEALADELRPIFDKADELAYAGAGGEEYPLSEWRTFVTTYLKKLESLKA